MIGRRALLASAACALATAAQASKFKGAAVLFSSIAVPAGLGYSAPWTTERLASGQISYNFDITNNIPAPGYTYYLDPVNGNDTNSGLTPTSAFKTLAHALGQQSAGINITINLVLSADFVARGSNGWNNLSSFTANVAVINRTGYRFFSVGGSSSAAPTWTLTAGQTAVYQYTGVASGVIDLTPAARSQPSIVVPAGSYQTIDGRWVSGDGVTAQTINHCPSLVAVAATAVVGAVNPITSITGTGSSVTVGFSSTSPYYMVGQNVTLAGCTPSGYNGTYQITSLTSQSVTFASTTTGTATTLGTLTSAGGSITMVAANPGSWWSDGTNTYFQAYNSRVPDNWVVISNNTNNGRAGGQNNQTTYVEGVDFIGGQSNFYAINLSTVTGQVFSFNRCSFQGASSTNAVSIQGFSTAYLSQCLAANSASDGYNYHSYESDGTTPGTSPNYHEFACVAVGNGISTPPASNNCSTSHDYCVGTRLNCIYINSTSLPLGDTNHATTWQAGCFVGPSLYNTSAYETNAGALSSSSQWYDTCTFAPAISGNYQVQVVSPANLYYANMPVPTYSSAGSAPQPYTP